MAVLSDDLLRECLEEAVSETLGRKTVFADIRWKRCEFESSYDTYVVTLSFPDHRELRVFLKDYGSYRQPKDGMESRRERELHVYSNLLANSGLDTARSYGSVWDHSAGRFWLLLEFVEGTPLKHSEFEYWPQAAAWLGRMQGYFAQDPDRLKCGNLLLDHDARFFLSTAERALRAVRELFPPLARSLEAIVNRYDRLVEVMVNQPRTLVHGTYRPGQILVDPRRQPPRFCPVDWELAAIGSSFYDLAFLADGFKPPRLDRVLGAYREEAAKYDFPVPSGDDLKYIVNSFRLHKVFNWLSQAAERKYSQDTVIKLTKMATQVADSVL